MPQPTKSPYVEVRASRIHGTGIYAKLAIPEGTRIIKYTGTRVTKREAERIGAREAEGCVYLFELNRRFDINGNVRWNTARHINHSCDPNCESINYGDCIWLHAVRDIAPGEELTYDYCFASGDLTDHLCRCGAANCRGYIVREDLVPTLPAR